MDVRCDGWWESKSCGGWSEGTNYNEDMVDVGCDGRGVGVYCDGAREIFDYSCGVDYHFCLYV